MISLLYFSATTTLLCSGASASTPVSSHTTPTSPEVAIPENVQSALGVSAADWGLPTNHQILAKHFAKLDDTLFPTETPDVRRFDRIHPTFNDLRAFKTLTVLWLIRLHGAITMAGMDAHKALFHVKNECLKLGMTVTEPPGGGQTFFLSPVSLSDMVRCAQRTLQSLVSEHFESEDPGWLAEWVLHFAAGTVVEDCPKLKGTRWAAALGSRAAARIERAVEATSPRAPSVTESGRGTPDQDRGPSLFDLLPERLLTSTPPPPTGRGGRSTSCPGCLVRKLLRTIRSLFRKSVPKEAPLRLLRDLVVFVLLPTLASAVWAFKNPGAQTGFLHRMVDELITMQSSKEAQAVVELTPLGLYIAFTRWGDIKAFWSLGKKSFLGKKGRVVSGCLDRSRPYCAKEEMNILNKNASARSTPDGGLLRKPKKCPRLLPSSLLRASQEPLVVTTSLIAWMYLAHYLATCDSSAGLCTEPKVLFPVIGLQITTVGYFLSPFSIVLLNLTRIFTFLLQFATAKANWGYYGVDTPPAVVDAPPTSSMDAFALTFHDRFAKAWMLAELVEVMSATLRDHLRSRQDERVLRSRFLSSLRRMRTSRASTRPRVVSIPGGCEEAGCEEVFVPIVGEGEIPLVPDEHCSSGARVRKLQLLRILRWFSVPVAGLSFGVLFFLGTNLRDESFEPTFSEGRQWLIAAVEQGCFIGVSLGWFVMG